MFTKIILFFKALKEAYKRVNCEKLEAKKHLNLYNIEFVGEGNIVIDQSPKGDTRYYETGTIKLLMSDK